MPKMIQLRNVPDEVHRVLKRRAVDEGTTLSELLVREVTAIPHRPTLDELCNESAGAGRYASPSLPRRQCAPNEGTAWFEAPPTVA